jgi:wyosine [tRNA(Phe)-imidazoG37] synthetase (radical SAM superfamily)
MSENQKTVYGPVHSWRFGSSLGLDPIFEISTCSFNCIYCQLGNIQKITTERKIYVPTEKVIADFKEFLDKPFEVITFSGSGEPTLALNLKEIAEQIKILKPQIPLLCLTNSTLLHLPEVQENLQIMDRVIVKLDAGDNKTLQQMNRPADGVSLESIIAGIKAFKAVYKGKLDVQMMFMPVNLNQLEDLAILLKEIQPDTVQLNTPLRPYPIEWNRDSRGNHTENRTYTTRTLKVVSKKEAETIQNTLRERTNLNILSVYRE